MRECRVCKVSKVCNVIGRRLRNDSRIFGDEKGRQWNGNTCPSCQHANVEARRAASGHKAPSKPRKESGPSTQFGPAQPLFAPKLRACRTCKTMNPNYYECDPCRSSKFDPGCLDEVGFVDMVGGRVGSSSAGWAY